MPPVDLCSTHSFASCDRAADSAGLDPDHYISRVLSRLLGPMLGRPNAGRLIRGLATRPSRCASLRAAFLTLRIASTFSRDFLSDGFS